MSSRFSANGGAFMQTCLILQYLSYNSINDALLQFNFTIGSSGTAWLISTLHPRSGIKLYQILQ